MCIRDRFCADLDSQFLRARVRSGSSISRCSGRPVMPAVVLVALAVIRQQSASETVPVTVRYWRAPRKMEFRASSTTTISGSPWIMAFRYLFLLRRAYPSQRRCCFLAAGCRSWRATFEDPSPETASASLLVRCLHASIQEREGVFFYGSAKTNTPAAFPGFSSGVSRRAVLETRDGPVVTATYCLPPTAKEIGNPLTGELRFVSHKTLPVLSSNARKFPASSPPKISPPPVATTERVPARCSYFQAVWPVSTETAYTVPTLSM